MKQILMAAGLSLLIQAVASDTRAEVWKQTLPMELPSAPGVSLITELLTTPATPEVISGEAIVFAEIRFFDELPIGTEVELWPASTDSASVDSTYGRIVWTTDARTGQLVRFDVTRIVRAWESAVLPNHGLIIRLSDEGIQPGDQIIKIGDEFTRELALADAVKKMRGPKDRKSVV